MDELKRCSPLSQHSEQVSSQQRPALPRSAACCLASTDSCLVEHAVYMIWWMCSSYDTCFCIHWTLCLASSIGPWVICLYCVSDTNEDTIPLVSSCTCRWPRRAATQASCCFSSNRLPCSPLPFPLSATTLRLAGVLRSLKACTALRRQALTCIFPRPAVPPTRICFLLCCQVAPLPSVDPLHFGDLPPRLPWEPATLFRAPAPATPQHTTNSSMCQGNPLSFHLSVSFTDTLSPFPSSSLSSSVLDVRHCCSSFPQYVSCTPSSPYPSLSLTSVCGISRMSKQCSRWPAWTKTETHVVHASDGRAQTYTQK